MHSSRPDCVFGEARLISSTRTTLANTGPGWKSKRASRWLKTLVPTRSAGNRSEVHWTRAYSASSERASARASAVLPTPGASSISTWPSASSATIRSRTTRSDAFTARAMFSASRVPISATPEGSSLGAVAIASWYAGLQAAGWLSTERVAAGRGVSGEGDRRRRRHGRLDLGELSDPADPGSRRGHRAGAQVAGINDHRPGGRSGPVADTGVRGNGPQVTPPPKKRVVTG